MLELQVSQVLKIRAVCFVFNIPLALTLVSLHVHTDVFWEGKLLQMGVSKTVRNMSSQVRNKPTVSFVSEDAADLESVELVANEVLAMQMPTTLAQLQNLTDEIRQKVGELGGVETILQQSADDIQRAESLLEHAHRARWVLAVHPGHVSVIQ